MVDSPFATVLKCAAKAVAVGLTRERGSSNPAAAPFPAYLPEDTPSAGVPPASIQISSPGLICCLPLSVSDDGDIYTYSYLPRSNNV